MTTETQTLRALTLAALLAVSGAVTSSAQNLIVNGDFKANAALFTAPEGQLGAGGNPATVTGWTHSGAGVAGLNGDGTGAGYAYQPEAGGTGYTFVYQHWTGGADGWSQSLSGAYVPNTSFTLGFDAASFRWSPATDFRVMIGDNSNTHFTTQAAGVDLAPLNAFTHYSYTFTSPAAFDGAAVIRLLDVAPNAGGVVFANISLEVAAVPEPTTAALAGLGVVLAGIASRRRNS